MPEGVFARGWLTACFAPGLTDRHRRALFAASGRGVPWPERARTSAGRAFGIDVVSALTRGASDPRMTAALDWLSADAHWLLTVDDDDYPAALRELPDSPLVLYGAGRRDLLGGAALAVVGSRNPTALGEQTAEAFARALADAGVTVVSGLALGIDAAAHRGALAGVGSTVAVVGTGLDIVYPPRNRALAQRIAADGCLLSEFALGTPARAEHFPRRNRILAGLTLGCLVVEANPRSGSLITARLAAEYGREVFAIPGPIHSPLARGCHALIKQGAKLTETAEDILGELAGPLGRVAGLPAAAPEPQRDAASGGTASAGTAGATSGRQPVAAFSVGDGRLTSPARQLLAVLPHGPISVDALSTRLGWTPGEVNTALLELELAGRAARCGHAAWQRLAAVRIQGHAE